MAILYSDSIKKAYKSREIFMFSGSEILTLAPLFPLTASIFIDIFPPGEMIKNGSSPGNNTNGLPATEIATPHPTQCHSWPAQPSVSQPGPNSRRTPGGRPVAGPQSARSDNHESETSARVELVAEYDSGRITHEYPLASGIWSVAGSIPRNIVLAFPGSPIGWRINPATGSTSSTLTPPTTKPEP